ncbi:hypothetical protein M1437_00990 [Patescibacteria group bacterium]|nr:hypothetical protein [Patescibacteria group bacterium]
MVETKKGAGQKQLGRVDADVFLRRVSAIEDMVDAGVDPDVLELLAGDQALYGQIDSRGSAFSGRIPGGRRRPSCSGNAALRTTIQYEGSWGS